MARTNVAGRRAAAQRIPLKPNEQASADASTLSCDLNGIRSVADFLDDMEFGSTSGQIPEETQRWLRGILHDWIRDTAGRLESAAERLEKFLDEQAKVAVA
jgi:hypothetical protein